MRLRDRDLLLPGCALASDLVLENSKLLSIFYDLDTPVTLNALGRQGTVDYIPSYGLGPSTCLSYTGGNALRELQNRLGAQRVAPSIGSRGSQHASSGGDR